MGCSVCGSKDSKPIKHLPLPNGENGWITLTYWTEYCTPCANNEAIEVNKAFEISKEGIEIG